MGYNNNRGNYDNNARYRNNDYAPNNAPRQIRKHSGCSAKQGFKKDGTKFYTVNGWMYRKGTGLTTYFAKSTSKSAEHVSGSNKVWINVLVEIVQKNTGFKQITSGLLDKATNKVIMKNIGMVMNPKAPNGGYCGPIGGK